MSSNIFNVNRFVLLCRQHFIHNTRFLLLSTVAYIGVVFIVLSIAQAGNDLLPLDLNAFQGFLIVCVAVFAILYVGHSFPAFRSKESTINYLMLPASVLEKFLFEFVIRIVIMIPTLPLLYWVTFHLQGYVFATFTDATFIPIGLQYLLMIEDVPDGYHFVIYTLITAAALLALVLVFTGAVMFTKQPLVKTLFAVAVIVMFFMLYSYIVIMHLGVGRYNPPDDMYLVPMNNPRVLQLISIALILTIMVMLFVAFRKLKEREV